MNYNYNPNSKLIHELWSKTFGQGKLKKKKKRLKQSKETKSIEKAEQGLQFTNNFYISNKIPFPIH